MFQETLLESSPTPKRRSGWSLATAFTAQTLIAAALIVVPLLSSAVITISTPAMPIPLSYAKPMADTPRASSGGTSASVHFAAQQEVVNMNLGGGSLIVGNPRVGNSGPSDPSPCLVGASCPVGDGGPPNLLPPGPTVRPEPPVKRIISRSSDALLINKVIPTYPIIAVRSGVQGEVRLHAIIARDGTIQSLSVISGHPLLTGAAIEAVQQWRYEPYRLNGETVEVETYITVNFKKGI
jgi:periplasmic protein TonB